MSCGSGEGLGKLPEAQVCGQSRAARASVLIGDEGSATVVQEVGGHGQGVLRLRVVLGWSRRCTNRLQYSVLDLAKLPR